MAINFLSPTLFRKRARGQTNRCADSTLFACPCGGIDYEACCGRYHIGAPAPDAATLMRSRYSAYVLQLDTYLLATWHSDTRPDRLDFDEGAKWLGLEIKTHTPEKTDRASVEFVARYKIGGRAHRLHEISRFVLEEGQWFYVDGEFPNASE